MVSNSKMHLNLPVRGNNNDSKKVDSFRRLFPPEGPSKQKKIRTSAIKPMIKRRKEVAENRRQARAAAIPFNGIDTLKWQLAAVIIIIIIRKEKF